MGVSAYQRLKMHWYTFYIFFYVHIVLNTEGFFSTLNMHFTVLGLILWSRLVRVIMAWSFFNDTFFATNPLNYESTYGDTSVVMMPLLQWNNNTFSEFLQKMWFFFPPFLTCWLISFDLPEQQATSMWSSWLTNEAVGGSFTYGVRFFWVSFRYN